MQIDGKGIENFLMNTMLKNSNTKKTISKKYTFPCLFTWEWAKWIVDWNLVGKNPMGPYNHLT
jgi:hypothetical protein